MKNRLAPQLLWTHSNEKFLAPYQNSNHNNANAARFHAVKA